MSDILKAAAHPMVFPWLCLVLGLVVGSFLNVVIHRLPKMMERGWQEECADLRGEAIAPAERFNLFVPRSRCSACKTRISPRYPLVELLGGAGAAWSAAHFGFGVAAFAAMVFLWCIVAASFIDFDTQLLPDSITLPLLWLGLLVNAGGVFTDLRSAVIGAAAGYLALWSVYWVFKLVTGKEGWDSAT